MLSLGFNRALVLSMLSEGELRTIVGNTICPAVMAGIWILLFMNCRILDKPLPPVLAADQGARCRAANVFGVVVGKLCHAAFKTPFDNLPRMYSKWNRRRPRGPTGPTLPKGPTEPPKTRGRLAVRKPAKAVKTPAAAVNKRPAAAS